MPRHSTFSNAEIYAYAQELCTYFMVEEPLDDIQKCAEIEVCLILKFSRSFTSDYEKHCMRQGD